MRPGGEPCFSSRQKVVRFDLAFLAQKGCHYMAKEFAKAFYRSKAWERCRVAYSKSVGGLCEDCLEKGLYTPGKIVHHIKHLTPDNIGNSSISLDWSNLRLVCQDCHAKEHKTESTARYAFDENGNIIDLTE